jgi:hypothetical protein
MTQSLGNISVHLGPQLYGTIGNTDPRFATTPGFIRNVGAGDGYQFGTLAYTPATTSASNLTYTQTNAASPTGIVCLPAGSYIDNINIDVTTAFNAGTNNTITVALSPTSATAGTTVMTLTGTGVNIATGRYTLGITISSAVVTQQNTAYWVNVSNGQTIPTDQIVMAWYTQTGTAATTGACTIGVDYVVRNPDGSYYQQTPTYPISTIPVVTY